MAADGSDLRARCLDAATELALEDVAGESAFAQLAGRVKLSDVAASLGVQRTSLYRFWPSQNDYRLDLATYLMLGAEREPFVTDALRGLPDAIQEHAPDLLEGCRQHFNAVQRRFIGDPRLVLRAAALAYPIPAALADRRRVMERQDREQATQHLALALRLAGRRPIRPLEIADLTMALACVVDTAPMVAWQVADSMRLEVTFPDEPDRPWTHLALAARCWLMELTEPGDPDPDPEADEVEADATDAGSKPADLHPQQLAALRAGSLVIDATVRADGEHEPTAITGLGHVTIDRVARRAGVTRREVYRLWPSQAEFRVALHAHINEIEQAAYLNDFDAAAFSVINTSADPRQLTLALCEAVNAHRYDGTIDRPYGCQAFLIEFQVPELRHRRRESIEVWLVNQAARFQLLGDLLGLDVRPGLRFADVALLILNAAGGSERLHRIDPEVIRTDLPYRGGKWTAFSIVCSALVGHCIADGGR